MARDCARLYVNSLNPPRTEGVSTHWSHPAFSPHAPRVTPSAGTAVKGELHRLNAMLTAAELQMQRGALAGCGRPRNWG
jgi:hypothetical protein